MIVRPRATIRILTGEDYGSAKYLKNFFRYRNKKKPFSKTDKCYKRKKLNNAEINAKFDSFTDKMTKNNSISSLRLQKI